jgi:hypothetical protein
MDKEFLDKMFIVFGVLSIFNAIGCLMTYLFTFFLNGSDYTLSIVFFSCAMVAGFVMLLLGFTFQKTYS